jgi:hypothetical protein
MVTPQEAAEMERLYVGGIGTPEIAAKMGLIEAWYAEHNLVERFDVLRIRLQQLTS